KLRIEGGRRTGLGFDPKVYFDIDGSPKLTVQCFPCDGDDVSQLQPGKEYNVMGKIDKFIPGRPIPLRESFFVDQGAGAPSGAASNKISMISGPPRRATGVGFAANFVETSSGIHTRCTDPEN